MTTGAVLSARSSNCTTAVPRGHQGQRFEASKIPRTNYAEDVKSAPKGGENGKGMSLPGRTRSNSTALSALTVYRLTGSASVREIFPQPNLEMHERHAIAKTAFYIWMTTDFSVLTRKVELPHRLPRDAPYIIGALKILSPWVRPRELFSKFLTDFCSDRSCNVRTQFWSS